MTPYNRFYKCQNFKIQELVDKITYEKLGDNCWQLFDPYALSTMDRIRDRYNLPVVVNNWHTGGEFQFRGFRPSWCKVGADLGSHRRGTAFDFDVIGMAAEAVRKDILANKEHIDFMFINRLEIDIPWVHMDVINVPTRIQIFKPSK